MCGRYYFDIDEKELKNIIDTVQENLYGEIKTGEIYPTNNVVIITSDKDKTLAVPAKWGFPKWDGKGVVINARVEGLSEKRMFKSLVDNKRCIILASAYYEWKKDNSNKNNKYEFKKDNSVLYMAGLYNNFYDKGKEQLSLFGMDNGDYTAFTIITKEANSYVTNIHDRMPLIFSKEEMKYYLSGENLDFLLAENNCKLSYSLVA